MCLIQTKIGQRCCAKRAMSPHVVGLLIENAEADLVIDDCTLLEPADLEAALCSVAGPRQGWELGSAVVAAE